MIDLPSIILASGSPRRAEILTSVGWNYRKEIPDVDETEHADEDPSAYVQRLAFEKASVVSTANPKAIVLGADTTVVINGMILGKPTDESDARRMLRLLSGRWHEVLTGVAIVKSDAAGHVAFERTRVLFEEMNDAEVDFLVRCGSPLDKAGGYAVQAQAALFIKQIDGDYWNVVGLPIGLVYRMMRSLNLLDRDL